ncbi:MAG: LysM peptidoglycan-binding domain-containing protein [Candidatus Aminicenantes bacterium]|nr:LysM peptidoglycan-binding domain-containing protein [Candidatus Aminicenantes bacterium]
MSTERPKPDVSQISLKDLPEKPFAAEGEPPLRVSFSAEAYEAVLRHARENTAVEVCGVLAGLPARDKQGAFLEIEAAVRGEHADARAGQVTFTHETWDHVQRVLAEEHPGLKVVGWYHSHPGYGLFLSQQDEFIHGQFFSLPWQVAFVVDPVAGEDGFFVWRQGKPERMSAYWVGGAKRTPSPDIAALRAGMNGAVEEVRAALKTSRRSRWRFVPAVAGFLFLALLAAAGLLQARRYFNHLVALQEAAVSRNVPLPEPTDGLQALLKSDALLEGVEVRLFKLGPFVWCEGTAWTYDQKERAARVLRSAPGVRAADMTGLRVTHEYVTSSGETLASIAVRVYGREARWRDLLEANRDRVDDPRRLRAGLTLRIPE